MNVASTSTAAPRASWRLSARARKALITLHVVGSVGLLGSTSATLVLALTAATTDDPEFAHSAYRFMATFSAAFGIPLSFTALLSGILLGVGTGRGVLRHWWTTAKLALILVTIGVGALVIGPGVEAMLDGSMESGFARWRPVVGAGINVVTLTAAVALSVFKPGGRFRDRRAR